VAGQLIYYLGRLAGILLKRTLSSNKLDEIKVLSSFLKQKAEKVEEKVKGEL